MLQPSGLDLAKESYLEAEILQKIKMKDCENKRNHFNRD